jgi:hypothetical protein
MHQKILTVSIQCEIGNRKEEKVPKEKETSHTSKHSVSSSYEEIRIADLESQLQSISAERTKWEMETASTQRKLEQLEGIQKELAQTREKLARLEGQNIMMTGVYDYVMSKLSSGQLPYQQTNENHK